MALLLKHTLRRVGGTDIRRWMPCLANPGDDALAFAGFQADIGRFEPQGAQALVFRSEWGREMTPRLVPAAGLSLAVRSGRSCCGAAPYAFLREENGAWHWYAVCWPGNWRLTFTEGGRVIFAMDEDMLSGTLAPGETLPLPQALTADGGDSRDALCRDVCAYLRDTLPPTRLRPEEISWNHWWRYEDAEITEDVVLRNARAAAELGLTQVVLDAGWFGDADGESHWTRLRGDWERVNHRRFPHGLAWLAEQIHGLGLRFGLWVEPEGMGADSRLRGEHPEWEALRDGKPLQEPCLCLGAEGAAEHVYEQLARLIRLTKADWVKLDFNVNPGLGCNRGDHGHAPGMGLYSHVTAYMALLNRLRETFPGLVVENCASGGMRMDLCTLAHTDVCFLSDPDETPHSLQVFLSLSFLPPERLLHWAWSDTRLYPDGSRVFPGLPGDAAPSSLASALEGAMLHPWGISRELTTLTAAQRETLRAHVRLYREAIAPMLARSRLHLLTPPPLRQGERARDDGRQAPWEGTSAACLLEDGRRGWLLVLGQVPRPLTLPEAWASVKALRRVTDGAVLPWTGRLPPPEGMEAVLYELMCREEEKDDGSFHALPGGL